MSIFLNSGLVQRFPLRHNRFQNPLEETEMIADYFKMIHMPDKIHAHCISTVTFRLPVVNPLKRKKTAEVAVHISTWRISE